MGQMEMLTASNGLAGATAAEVVRHAADIMVLAALTAAVLLMLASILAGAVKEA